MSHNTGLAFTRDINNCMSSSSSPIFTNESLHFFNTLLTMQRKVIARKQPGKNQEYVNVSISNTCTPADSATGRRSSILVDSSSCYPATGLVKFPAGQTIRLYEWAYVFLCSTNLSGVNRKHAGRSKSGTCKRGLTRPSPFSPLLFTPCHYTTTQSSSSLCEVTTQWRATLRSPWEAKRAIFRVLTVVLLKIPVFRDATPPLLAKTYRRFEGSRNFFLMFVPYFSFLIPVVRIMLGA